MQDATWLCKPSASSRAVPYSLSFCRKNSYCVQYSGCIHQPSARFAVGRNMPSPHRRCLLVLLGGSLFYLPVPAGSNPVQGKEQRMPSKEEFQYQLSQNFLWITLVHPLINFCIQVSPLAPFTQTSAWVPLWPAAPTEQPSSLLAEG